MMVMVIVVVVLLVSLVLRQVGTVTSGPSAVIVLMRGNVAAIVVGFLKGRDAFDVVKHVDGVVMLGDKIGHARVGERSISVRCVGLVFTVVY